MNSITETAADKTASMYEKVESIRNLNKAEGFDPRNYMRILPGPGQTEKLYLDVAYRKLWFRLINPGGRIEKRLIKLNENSAVVEARIYLKHDDPEGQFVANAFAQRSFNENYGYLECAETAAIGRALSDAGFGSQFADLEREADPQPADTPVSGTGGERITEQGIAQDTAGFIAAGPKESDQLPGQYSIEELLAMEAPEIMAVPETVAAPVNGTATENRTAAEISRVPGAAGNNVRTDPPALSGAGSETGTQTGPAAVTPIQAAPMSQAVPMTEAVPELRTAHETVLATESAPATEAVPVPAATPETEPGKKDMDPAAQIRKDMPVEQIYGLLDRETAAAVVVSAGFLKGRTLGLVSVEKPDCLKWYVESYGGPDNLLRAAAQFLLDYALRQAS